MKERLEQLRAMDSAAFMTLPASSFSPIPKESLTDPEEIAAASSPYTNLNGYLPHAEGERRRKEMLEVATMLEERYRVLLPPDRVRRALEPASSESASRNQGRRDGDDSETETDQVSVGEKLRLRLPARSSTSTTPAPSPAAVKPVPTIKKPRPSVPTKQSSVIRVLRTVVSTPSPPASFHHAERSVTLEPLSISPGRERTTTPELERLLTLPVPERPITPLADVAGQDLQDSLPEEEPSNRNFLEPRIAVDGESEVVEIEDKMSVRAESEVPAPQNEPEREEVDINSGDEMPIWGESEAPALRNEPEREEVDIESGDKMPIWGGSEAPAPQNAPEREEIDIESRNKMPIWDESEAPAPQDEPEREVDVESRDKMPIRGESEAPAPQNEPEREVDIESGDKMPIWVEYEAPALRNEPEREEVGIESEVENVEQDGTIEQAAVADVTMDVIPDTMLTEQTGLPEAPMTQEVADSGPTVIEQADVQVSEAGLNLDRPVTPELKQRPRTESVDIEKTPSPVPISSISASRGRGRKKARLDPSVQPYETVSAPVRGLRVPKNHVTYIGASGEMEVTACAIIKAAVHRTQREVTRHLNAFGVPVPNAIVQIGPDFELPEWIFPPLSPAESEHEQGDFDDIEALELDLMTQSGLSPPVQVDHKESMQANPDAMSMAADHVPMEVGPVPTRQSGSKSRTLPLPPPPKPKTDEDAVSLDNEDI